MNKIETTLSIDEGMQPWAYGPIGDVTVSIPVSMRVIGYSVDDVFEKTGDAELELVGIGVSLKLYDRSNGKVWSVRKFISGETLSYGSFDTEQLIQHTLQNEIDGIGE